MTQSIKLTTDQMRMMSLFQNVTGATARDCVEDEKQDRVIFVVNSGKMGDNRQYSPFLLSDINFGLTLKNRTCRRQPHGGCFIF